MVKNCINKVYVRFNIVRCLCGVECLKEIDILDYYSLNDIE